MRQKYRRLLLTIVEFILIVQHSMAKVIDASETVVVAELPLGLPALRELAADICSNLFFDQNYTKEDCLKRFIKPIDDHLIKEIPSRVKVICQDQQSVKLVFAPSPSELDQVVVLVPTDPDMMLEYSMMFQETGKYIKNVRIRNTSYRIYSTVFDNTGARGLWAVGSEIYPLEDDMLSSSKINISQDDFTYKGHDYEESVQATFSWQSINECKFFVMNYCKHQGKLIERDITDGEIIGGRRSITLKLPLADECTIDIRGGNRNGSYTYHTPKCVTRDDGVVICKTENVKNISIYVSEAAKEGDWDVAVSWNKPHKHPKQYNITLRYNEQSIYKILHGNAHQVVFHNILGSGLFEVTVVAVYHRMSTIASRKGQFPTPNWAAHALAYVTAGALLLALLATALAVSRRKLRDRRVQIYFPDLEEKSRKVSEDSTEASWSTSTEEDAWELPPERLMLQQVLGEGAFGVVRRASLAPGGVVVAVKMLKDFPTLEEVRSFRAEMELMKSVGGHAHVVSMLGCCSGRRPAIVAEYCSRGDLLNYLRSAWNIMITKHNKKYYNNNEYSPDYRDGLEHNTTIFVNKLYDMQGVCDSELTPVELLSFCRQVAMGMEFLATNRVVHRDLAARNILVSEDKTLKIADFGLSRDVYQDNLYKQRGNGKVPVKWMAIESLTHRLFTTQSDVWSFGVVMWEVVTVGGLPYAGVSSLRLPRMLRAGYRMPPPSNCTQPLYEIMLSCWSSRPRERPSFSELHARLDELLQTATADNYLTLQIDYEDRAPVKKNKYKALLARSKLTRWMLRDSYEYPLKPATDNHYISSPIGVVKTQVLST